MQVHLKLVKAIFLKIGIRNPPKISKFEYPFTLKSFYEILAKINDGR